MRLNDTLMTPQKILSHPISSILTILLVIGLRGYAQDHRDKLLQLPVASGPYVNGMEGDWLLVRPEEKARVMRNKEGNELVLTNGIISRSFRLFPDAATVSFKILGRQEELIRAIKPEAVITVEDLCIKVGGLEGQPNLAFLLPDWLDSLEADPLAFHCTGFHTGPAEKRFEWKQVRHHAPDAEWPPGGVHLQMDYRLGECSPLEWISLSRKSSTGRRILIHDDFSRPSPGWKIRTSPLQDGSSFMKGGKPGVIYTPNNTAVYAEHDLPSGVGLVEVSIDAGTDLSGFWGPGIALCWKDRTIKFNMRPGNESGVKNDGAWRFTVYDGRAENTRAGGKQYVDFGKTWLLRLRIDGTKVYCEARPSDGMWKTYHVIDFGAQVPDPMSARIGKLGENASGEDHSLPGEPVCLTINAFSACSKPDEAELGKVLQKMNDLRDLVVSVNYELYQGIPVMSKWVTLKNNSLSTIRINNVVSEYLGIADHDPYGGYRGREDLKVKPNIHFETDYAFSAGRVKVANRHVVHWEPDQEYVTQISWIQDIPNTMRIFPEMGYHQQIDPGGEFETIRTFILPYDAYEKERNGLALRKMYRTIAPWVTENPLMFHLTRSGWEDFTRGIDQCAEVGYEMLNLSFGSGLDPEDESDGNDARMKEFAAYANSKGISIGTYSLLASRSISMKDDVVNPKTGIPGGFATFGNSPCLCSEWGEEYFRKLYRMFSETGFIALTHDGSYPGDVCASSIHPGHKGLADSRYRQWLVISGFYKWCKGQGVYLRIPDYYYLVGGNQCGVGYRENNWSLPRRQQLIHTRQNIYDGTWESTPSMRWSFIPLAQYHGGGAAATIEPLNEHLDHYEMMLVSNLGSGIQSALRGPRLYDTEETRNMIKRVVAWYKQYRDILESDIIHLRRADGRDIDYMMHVNPHLEFKGLLLVFNPTDHAIRKQLKISLYYTGLKERALVRERENEADTLRLDRDYQVEMEVEVAPNWYNWYLIR